ncbi:MAG TPA: VOC family protein [Streptosporangiaceae bacterium]|nr:VOC family protein [Streptosporangiaceae bacterium]
MLTHIDHVGIACHDLEEKVAFYCSTFGLTVVSREINEEQGVREAMLRVAAAEPGGGGYPPGPPDLRSAAGLPAGRGPRPGVNPPPGPDLRAASGADPAARGEVGPATAGSVGFPVGDPGIAPIAASYIQLLEPLRPDSPVGKFLARRGEGLHHVGYGVTDIRAALAAIGAMGVRLIDERPRHGSMGASIAFLHPADVGGVLTELVQPADLPGPPGDPGWR